MNGVILLGGERLRRRSADAEAHQVAADQQLAAQRQRTAVAAAQVQPGDLVFFAGADGTVTDPGHVGLVIGNGKMIEAFATGFPIRVSSYQNRGAIGFTQPWANANASANPSTTPTPPAGGVPTPGVTAPSGR